MSTMASSDYIPACLLSCFCNRTLLSVPLFPVQFLIHFHLQPQELMLKKGMAWHYTAYDQRAELSKVAYWFFVLLYPIICDMKSMSWMLHEQWEKNARAKRVGLWASSNPEEPWEWRKNRREGRWRLPKSDSTLHSGEMQLAKCWSTGTIIYSKLFDS